MPASVEPISTPLRGRAPLNDPALNKGTAFTRAEREALLLVALPFWLVSARHQVQTA